MQHPTLAPPTVVLRDVALDHERIERGKRGTARLGATSGLGPSASDWRCGGACIRDLIETRGDGLAEAPDGERGILQSICGKLVPGIIDARNVV